MSCAELYEQMLEEEGYHEEPDEIEERKMIMKEITNGNGMTISNPQCHNCVHRDVCKIRSDYENTIDKIVDLMNKQCYGENFSFLSANLECKKYLREPAQIITTRGGTGVSQL